MISNLIGRWKSDPDDIVTQQYYGDVILDFRENGELIYTIIENDKEQKILMVYETDGDILITDQISHPQKMKTEFRLNDRSLELIYEGIKSRYIRIF
jgi:hypothetical protein